MNGLPNRNADPNLLNPARGPSGGTGQGSGSALDAMLKKRREGENEATETAPPDSEGGVIQGK